MDIFDLNSAVNDEDDMQSKYREIFKFNESFKFDKFQLISFREIDLNKNVLVSAPTSSGKTAVAEYALLKYVKEGKKVIYTSPIKSLSNEKYKEFKDKNICEVGILTGDNKINVDAQCTVMTAEILRNSLYKSDFDENIGCVIMDEVHFINDIERGKIWEETIILLPPTVKLIMLSATINNVNQFGNWIYSVRNDLSLIKSNRRIVPLTYYIYIDKLYKILDNDDKFYDQTFFDSKKEYEKLKINKDKGYFDKIIRFLIKNDLLQSIFFSFSRQNCELYASSISVNLLSGEESTNVSNRFDFLMSKYKNQYEIVPQYIKIKKLIEKGVCFHHSGVIPIMKEIIEILFREGFIKVLFATETFAVGVNMPTRTVLFTELTKPTNNGKRFINTAEFKQMSGRAGRRGKDIIGNVILLPYYDFPDIGDLKEVMIKTMPSIKSKFQIDYYYVLKTIQYKEEIYKNSLLNMENENSLKETEQYIQKLETKIKDFIFTDEELNIFNRISKIEKSFDRFIKPSKSQLKELIELKKSILSDRLDKLNEYDELKSKLNNYHTELINSKSYLNELSTIVKNILIDEKYIQFNNLTINLDIYGLCVINCNECNGILLTEIIRNGLLDKMSGNDIISFMSIFLSFKSEFFQSEYFKDEYDFVLKVINKWKSYETKYQLNINIEEFWDITSGYLDITYEWISMDVDNYRLKYILEYLQHMNEYEGNFVKNILKLYNICTCLKNILTLLGRLDITVKLEDLDKKLLKNIVNVNSLYLG
jgi:superfamily II RNA helicase